MKIDDLKKLLAEYTARDERFEGAIELVGQMDKDADEKAIAVCAEAYQLVGSISAVMPDLIPNVEKWMDNLAAAEVKHKDLLPFELDIPDDGFNKNTKVRKVGGDYSFEGHIVAVFRKLSKQMRYVVEDDRGVLHVYSQKNLELVNV